MTQTIQIKPEEHLGLMRFFGFMDENSGAVMAAFEYAEDAAMWASASGAQVRDRFNNVVWDERDESAYESYDDAAEIMNRRAIPSCEDEIHDQVAQGTIRILANGALKRVSR